jgi:hypothetical protein
MVAQAARLEVVHGSNFVAGARLGVGRGDK